MSKWISVDKQLPEKDGAYLCVVEYFSGPHIEIIDFATKLSDIDSYYFNGKHRKGWFEFDVDECTYWEILTVTHWMPLPEPPGEITVFDRLTESPEALARLILQMLSRDISQMCIRDSFWMGDGPAQRKADIGAGKAGHYARRDRDRGQGVKIA